MERKKGNKNERGKKKLNDNDEKKKGKKDKNNRKIKKRKFFSLPQKSVNKK